MTIGEKLQRLRKARGWTQEELAERVGVSRQSLSKWEANATLPDTANVIALADLFGVTTDYLLREDAAPPVRTESGEADAAAKPGRTCWYASPRELGGRLMVAGAAIGLIVLRVLASVYPARVGIDGREYTGFAAFLYYYDLWWALWLMAAMLLLGLVQWFWPWLAALAKRFRAWLKRTEK